MKESRKTILGFVGILLASSAILARCGNGSMANMGGMGGMAPAVFTQVERLARPAVNEGLVFTNDLLNAYNSVPPNADLTPAAQPVVDEVVTTLTALGNSATRIGDIAAAFLPDVMRIDTGIASPVGTGAYANGAMPFGTLGVVRPVAGRKLEDDVIDITLAVLTNGAVTSDNVSYVGEPGNPAQGHQLLNGQAAPLGPATFPFLAPAN